MSSQPEFSLILACYNEGPTFDESFKKIYDVLKKTKLSWEIILVEDKSIDETKANVKKTVDNYKHTKVIYHKVNQGRGKTVADGIFAAKGKICGFIDFDCEISPRYIPLFVAEIQKGADMVVAKRFYEKNVSGLIRVFLSRGYSILIKLLFGLPIEDTESGYKFFNRKSILPVLATVKDKGWFWDSEICIRSHEAGLKLHELPVLFIRRPEKQSTVNVFNDTVDYLIKLFNFKFRRND